MSNNTQTPAPTVIPESTETEANVEVAEKQSRRSRVKAFIKTNKAPIIGWGLLAGAMGAGAAIGRATAPSADPTKVLVLEPEDDFVTGEVLTVSDDIVA